MTEIIPPPITPWRKVSIEEAYHLGQRDKKVESYMDTYEVTASLLWRRMPKADFKRRTLA